MRNEGPYKIQPSDEDPDWYVVTGPSFVEAGDANDNDPMLVDARNNCNAAYQAGRSSRDGLRKVMETISYGLTLPEDDLQRAIRKRLDEALAEDAKNETSDR